MEITELVVETISRQHRNRFPLPNAPGAPAFRGRDVTTFLHKYESLAAFTATDVTESSVIAMLPYYCTEEIRETVMIMRGYTDRDWAALKKEMLDVFWYSDSRPDSLVYTRHYLEQLCATFRDSHRARDHAEFGGLDQKSFLRTYDHISGVVTERGMMCEYERTEMLLRALPKRLWRKAVTKLGMHPLEPSTFDYGKLHSWITAKITAAEALAMFEFTAHKSSAATDMTSTSSATASPMTLTAPTAPVPLMTSGTPTTSPAPMTPTTLTAPTASVTPMAPTISTTAHKSPAATDLTLTSSGTASPMTSTVPTAPTVQPTAPMTSKILTTPTAPIAPTAFTPPAPTASTASTARQGTIRAGPTVRLGIIRVEPPQGQKIRRHHYAQPEPIRPHRTESTVTCRSEPAAPTRQKPIKLLRSEPIVPSHNQPVPPYRQEPVQPPQQVDCPPCYYCADDQHNLRKCTDLRTDQWHRLLVTSVR
ncbi:hypothetical protein K440DRAFT_619284 [Wilcoxina mikolae CBS 423.85]|nr:hypothetical protein K440DRAFT_619284 [Wilcoxina mikolae CBS 423.85]